LTRFFPKKRVFKKAASYPINTWRPEDVRYWSEWSINRPGPEIVLTDGTRTSVLHPGGRSADVVIFSLKPLVEKNFDIQYDVRVLQI